MNRPKKMNPAPKLKKNMAAAKMKYIHAPMMLTMKLIDINDLCSPAARDLFTSGCTKHIMTRGSKTKGQIKREMLVQMMLIQ